jgi:hypothetical protein
MNTAVYDIETAILQAMDDMDYDNSNHSDFPIATNNLVANQSDYSIPTTTVRIKKAEITFDGTEWHKMFPQDEAESSLPSDATTIANNYSTSEPFYDIEAGSIIIKPTPSQNVTGGLKLWFSRFATAFTSSDMSTGTKTPGFDINFHWLVPYKMALEYCLQNDMNRVASLSARIAQGMEDLKKWYGKKNADTQYSLTSSNKNYN